MLLLLYGKMLPLGGIVWTASKGIQQLDRGVYSAGLPDPGVEAIDSGAVKQAAYALRLLHCLGHQTSIIPGTPIFRIGDVIPTPPIISHRFLRHVYHQLAEAGLGELD